jgi:ferrous iron transport protein B
VYLLLIGAFIQPKYGAFWSGFALFGMHFLGLLVAIPIVWFLNRKVVKGKRLPFMMELPPYRMPRLRTVGAIVWSHTREFLDRAGKVIFTVSVVVWLLIHVPFGAKPADSLVASAGKAITPIFAPIGLTDWRATTSLIPAFLAREVALSFMATIYAAEQEAEPPAQPMNVGEALQEQGVGLAEAVKNSVTSLFSLGFSTLEVTDNEDNALKDAVKNTFAPLSSLSFMILLLLYNSCLAVYSVMSKELGRKFANWFMVYSFIIGWVVAFVVYQGGRLLGGS